jgi:hypothetical protein
VVRSIEFELGNGQLCKFATSLKMRSSLDKQNGVTGEAEEQPDFVPDMGWYALLAERG